MYEERKIRNNTPPPPSKDSRLGVCDGSLRELRVNLDFLEVVRFFEIGDLVPSKMFALCWGYVVMIA